QVVGPLVGRTEGRPLVLVPTGALHGTPWAALPGIAPVLSVAPSAGLWMRGHAIEPLHHAPGDHRSGAHSRLTEGVRVLVAAGPRLAHAVAEAEDVAQRYPDAEVTLAPYATVEEVREALPTVDLAHLACHGHFRDDNPLFSALEFDGGRLSVFELERLSRVPRHLVLSACDSGRAAVRPGDELIGLTAALLRLGTQSLVASVLPVPDDATRRLMTALHGQLAAGLAPPHALAAARLQLDTTSDADLVAAAAFVAFGSD
ncbi:MAG: CHAT domain-containing protein, partial [Solirubrobacteraceae bacterium]|nr:CHAT domain-containing protein [Solirubrobacteraceae bacterium]